MGNPTQSRVITQARSAWPWVMGKTFKQFVKEKNTGSDSNLRVMGNTQNGEIPEVTGGGEFNPDRGGTLFFHYASYGGGSMRTVLQVLLRGEDSMSHSVMIISLTLGSFSKVM